jgi:hypothetical protein
MHSPVLGTMPVHPNNPAVVGTAPRVNAAAVSPILPKLPPAPPPPSPKPLVGFSPFNQVPFVVASVSPNLPGAANLMLMPSLQRFFALSQATQNFGQFANIPFFAFPGFNALAGAAATAGLFRNAFLTSAFNPFNTIPFQTPSFNPFNSSLFFPNTSFSPVLFSPGGF